MDRIKLDAEGARKVQNVLHGLRHELAGRPSTARIVIDYEAYNHSVHLGITDRGIISNESWHRCS